MSLQISQVIPWTKSSLISPSLYAKSYSQILPHQTSVQIKLLGDCLFISKPSANKKSLLAISKSDASIQLFEEGLAHAVLFGNITDEDIASIKPFEFDLVIAVGQYNSLDGTSLIVKSDVELSLAANAFNVGITPIHSSSIQSTIVHKIQSDAIGETFEIQLSANERTNSKFVSQAKEAARLSLEACRIEKDQGYAVQVSALNGLASIELGIIVSEVLQQLGQRSGLAPEYVFTSHLTTDDGTFGFGIALMPCSRASDHFQNGEIQEISIDRITNGVKISSKFPSQAVRTARYACEKLIANEPEITRLDVIAGDGDCGTTLKAGAEAVMRICTQNSDIEDDIDEEIGHFLESIADALEGSMGGTSGIIFTIFFRTWARKCEEQPELSILKAMKEALESLLSFTPARRGDRTLLDTLIPFVEQINENEQEDLKSLLSKGVEQARKGCDETKNMKPGLGRAIYVPQEGLEGVRDAGALGVLNLLEGAVWAV